MRNYNLLWGLWAIWALLIVIWFIDIPLDLPILAYEQILTVILGIGASGLMVFLYNLKRSYWMFSFDKSKKAAAAPQENSEINNPAELVNSVSPVRVKKDTFISQGAQMKGKLAVDGDITVEGHIEGDVQCDNTIKVEHGGQVKGEMTSRQIIINGHVEGRISASVVAIQAQGVVIGDIFSDELSIEKGGIFTGQSNPLKPEKPQQEKLTYVEKKKDKIDKNPIEPENLMALSGNNM
ncbi:bactofilin family protein [Brenneria izbisi]|uniref:Polymer-forming cytoskeletal protein n=1 Tax=Brenneria izbisi TaxID=2939450 RepID=A0AA42C452_9GAMM|nr:polymer-forming cytoskeletal protein [Brenneria izbisi]MCV9879680.1 polymer-forming cytoskeletal protein [Brenneria izbisi]MCV9883126.1 polymer-forming cytoskeletal protein [Brenneria izbisi]